MTKFQDSTPVYLQIANDIKEQIISGKLQEGEKIKSVREYSVLYEVTMLTAHRALQLLEAEVVVETKKGVGSFVIAGVQSVLEIKMVDMQVREFVGRMGNMGISKDDILQLVQEVLANE